jgi:hypothetical protein
MKLDALNLSTTESGCCVVDFKVHMRDVRISGRQYNKGPHKCRQTHTGTLSEALASPSFCRHNDQRKELAGIFRRGDLGTLIDKDLRNVTAPDQQQERKRRQTDLVLRLARLISDLTKAGHYGDPLVSLWLSLLFA